MVNSDRTWGITSGVGATALMVAATRAIETARPDALFRDEYAQLFLDAAETSELIGKLAGIRQQPGWQQLSTYMALRTRYLDEYFQAAARAGIDQVVILGAGLDVRADRLGWPPGCRVYELDQPEVLRFKQDVLDQVAHGEVRRPVPVDLREDWIGPLILSGFDPGRPTAWLIEGLLPYLSDEQVERILSLVNQNSSPDSRLSLEEIGSQSTRISVDDADFVAMSRHLGIDMSRLWNTEPQQDWSQWLGRAGWRVHAALLSEVAHQRGRELSGGLGTRLASNTLVTAIC